MIKKIFPGILVILFAWLLWPQAGFAKSRASVSAEVMYKKAQRSYYNLKGSKKKRAYRHNWINSANKFIAVYEEYPDSKQAARALFTAGRLYHQLYRTSRNGSDLEQARHFYYKLVSEFEDNRLTDDALFHQASIQIKLRKYTSANELLKRIVRDYGNGDQAKKALTLLNRTRAFVKAVTVAKTNPGKKSTSLFLQEVNYTRNKKSSKIIVELTGRAKITHTRLTNPDRLVIDFSDTRLSKKIIPQIKVNDSVLKAIQTSQFNTNTSRLILHLHPEKNVDIVTTRNKSSLLIELQNLTPPSIQAVLSGVKRVASKPLSIIQTPPPSNRENKKNTHRRMIIVDAGHGGKDLGAKGKHGGIEKDINLQISKYLKAILQNRYKYRVVMTRKDDTFIPLEDRGKIANQKHADLFVSIHANAAKRSGAHGIETYYLGAGHNKQAQETAARENGHLVYSVKDNQVQQILASLISTTKINDSASLAGHVQKSLYGAVKKRYSKVKNLGVKEGPFFVLHDTSMPSILVEVGFLTHRQEEKRLKNARYLRLLAESIARGVHEFLQEKGSSI
jgi:N-acetylmuramoyl-L-alanine amidase